jgi:hypothetical protein
MIRIAATMAGAALTRLGGQLGSFNYLRTNSRRATSVITRANHLKAPTLTTSQHLPHAQVLIFLTKSTISTIQTPYLFPRRTIDYDTSLHSKMRNNYTSIPLTRLSSHTTAQPVASATFPSTDSLLLQDLDYKNIISYQASGHSPKYWTPLLQRRWVLLTISLVLLLIVSLEVVFKIATNKYGFCRIMSIGKYVGSPTVLNKPTQTLLRPHLYQVIYTSVAPLQQIDIIKNNNTECIHSYVISFQH